MKREEIKAALAHLFPRVDREEIKSAILDASVEAFRVGGMMPFTYDAAAEISLRVELLGALEELVERAVYAYAHSRNLEAILPTEPEDGRRLWPGNWELRLRTSSGITGSLCGPRRSERPPHEIRLPVMHQRAPGAGYVAAPVVPQVEMPVARFELDRLTEQGIAYYREVLNEERYFR